jgi:hypothetical protein
MSVSAAAYYTAVLAQLALRAAATIRKTTFIRLWLPALKCRGLFKTIRAADF